MRNVNEIREFKKRPKLKDLLNMMKGKNMKDPKVKEQMRNLILVLYDPESVVAEEDVKYNKLMQNFDRI